MLSTIGLVFDCLGVSIIMIHTLYDIGIEAATRIMEKMNIEEDQKLIAKFKDNEKLSSKEKERVKDLVKENFTLNSLQYFIMLWVWINRHIFRFTPWIEGKPRLINRYLWNFCGLFLILIGFILQLVGGY
ncbi:hypothetical protein ACFL1K_04325 [Candidatus Omnitrophota bacterium]